MKGVGFKISLYIESSNLYQSNVVIDDEGVARITDFGLSRSDILLTLWVTSTREARGTIRWMAPELIDGTSPIATTRTDVFAYGMTVLVSPSRPTIKHCN